MPIANGISQMAGCQSIGFRKDNLGGAYLSSFFIRTGSRGFSF
jgi:hypothetical protein